MAFLIRKSKHSVASLIASSGGFGLQIPPCVLFRICKPAPRARATGDSGNQQRAAYHHDTSAIREFPEGEIKFTSQMSFLPETARERVYCYQVLNDDGTEVSCDNRVNVSKETATKMYTDMVTLQAMDALFYEAQRQGRISFYATTTGEEAINIASAAALRDDDIIVPQYREPGPLLWRGFTIQEFANQCFGNKFDYGKGKGQANACPLCSQLPHAVGAAYSLKMDCKDACVVTFFGDGGSSEGDFHAALNFAAVTEAPVIFICRNNGWAISTPAKDQFRSDGVVVRGQAYGVRSIRVDGNDALAMLGAVQSAREMAVVEGRPILIEALTYRVGHHSTSDDSTKYRPAEEIEWWRTNRDPVTRFRKWIEGNSWWDGQLESELRDRVRKEILYAIQVAEKAPKPSIADIFTDVYDVPPSTLSKQEKLVRETIKAHPFDYPPEYSM